MYRKLGVLPHQTICEMVQCEAIQGSSVEMAQSVSLDLTVSEEVYRIRSVFLPRPGEPVCDAISQVCPERHDLSMPLEVDVTYAFRLNESLSLPRSIYGYTNPKSTSGRNDTHVRVLADGMSRFDSVGQKGYQGSLWSLVTPRSFRVLLHPGNSLSHILFFNEDTRFRMDYELEVAYKKHQLLFGPDGRPIPYKDILMTDNDGALILTLDLDLDIVGYRCEGSQEVLDWSKEQSHVPDGFFQKIPRPKDGSLTLRKGDFYILMTKEFLRVPPDLSAEMLPIDIRSGDYRAQYAGYFAPGWGHGWDGSVAGAPMVMEVRSFEDNIVVRDGQPICKVAFERVTEMPEVIYEGNYRDQREPRLSKHFART